MNLLRRGSKDMTNLSTPLAVGAVVAFVLAAVGVSLGGVDMIATGLALLAGAAVTD